MSMMDWYAGAIDDARWWAHRLDMHTGRALERIRHHAEKVAHERGHDAVTPGDVDRACVWVRREVEGSRQETE